MQYVECNKARAAVCCCCCHSVGHRLRFITFRNSIRKNLRSLDFHWKCWCTVALNEMKFIPTHIQHNTNKQYNNNHLKSYTQFSQSHFHSTFEIVCVCITLTHSLFLFERKHSASNWSFEYLLCQLCIANECNLIGMNFVREMLARNSNWKAEQIDSIFIRFMLFYFAEVNQCI